MTKLNLSPIGLREANAYVREVHRHHDPVTGHKFSVALRDESGSIRGVGIAGRPTSRALQAQGFIEVVRVATDGTKNACSMIYGALRRAALALGYRPDQIVTYTLITEPGSSLRASGWIEDGVTSGGSWDRPSRARTDKAPISPKRRWVAGYTGGTE